MPVSADTFTISAIVLLIMGAVCFYLFTRIKQVEKKLTLMEGILLDLKTASEAGFLGFPAGSQATEEEDEDEEDEEEEEEEQEAEVFLPMKPDEELKPIADVNVAAEEEEQVRTIEIDEMAKEEAELTSETGSVQVNKITSGTDLDALSMAELTAIAKNRGMTVTSKMRKAQLVTALRQMEPPQSSVAPAEEQSPLDPDGLAAASSLLGGSSLMSSPL
jgi:Rho termination factor, N-terminal domain